MHVLTAEASQPFDDVITGAFHMPSTPLLAKDVARPVGAIRHRREAPPVLGVVAASFGVLVAAVVAVAGMAMVGGA